MLARLSQYASGATPVGTTSVRTASSFYLTVPGGGVTLFTYPFLSFCLRSTCTLTICLRHMLSSNAAMTDEHPVEKNNVNSFPANITHSFSLHTVCYFPSTKLTGTGVHSERIMPSEPPADFGREPNMAGPATFTWQKIVCWDHGRTSFPGIGKKSPLATSHCAM